jgi:hypothetical protein
MRLRAYLEITFKRISFHPSFQGLARVAPALFLSMLTGCVGIPRRVPPQQQPSPGPLACSGGEEWCNGECRDPGFFVNNNQNCGRCNNSCGAVSESCNGVSCGCAMGYTSCMGSCMSSVSFISDNNNCGSCGHSCSIGESCTGGICQKMPGLRSASATGKGSATPDSACDKVKPRIATARCSRVLSKLAPLCEDFGSPN